MTGIVRALLKSHLQEAILTPELVSNTIREVTQEYNARGCSVQEIGDGLCDSFVADVLDRLGYPPHDVIAEWGTEMFWEDTFKADINKVRALGEKIPNDVDLKALEDLLSQATHAWLHFRGKHYDAEAPEGVDNFLQLPFFARQINKLRGLTENYETGKPVEIEYVRNPEGAPNMGKQFGQHIEPSGRYMVAKHGRWVPEGWETGTIRFNNPLVLDWGSGLYTDEDNWKQVLHQKYGKTGKALSRALLKDGYDGIITLRDGETSEIVDLGVIR